MKFILTQASNMDAQREIELITLDDLVNLIDESEEGQVIIKTKTVTSYDAEKLCWVRERVTTPMIIIYDDYVE